MGNPQADDTKSGRNKVASHELQYKFEIVEGVDCIVWTFEKHLDSRRKRSIKEKVCQFSRDIITLDRRGLEYCDVIVVCSNLADTITRMVKVYTDMSYTVAENDLPHGKQMSFMLPNGSGIKASIYETHNKLMIQPLQKNECSIRQWIRLAPSFISKKDEPTQTTHSLLLTPCALNTDSSIVVHPPSASPHRSPPKIIRTKQLDFELLPSHHDQSSIHATNGEQATLESSGNQGTDKGNENIPVRPKLQAKGVPDKETENRKELSPGISVKPKLEGQPTIVVNELLCFIQNKIQSMAQDILIKLCAEFYTSEIISESKKILFDYVETNQKHRKKRGSGKDIINLKDICRIFLEMECNPTVHFVAADLTCLPPVSINNFDVLSVVQDVGSLKNHMQALTDQVKVLTSITRDLKETNRPKPRLVTPPRYSVPQQSGNVTYAMKVAESSTNSPSSSKTQPSAESFTNSPSPSKTQPTATSTPQGNLVDYTVLSEAEATLNESPWQVKTPKRHRRSSEEKPQLPTAQSGTGASTGLRAAQTRKYERGTVTGVFISRLHPHTTQRDIESCVKSHTGISISAVKLRVKYPDSYSSFYIRGDRKIQRLLLDTDLWPRYALVKPFEEK